MNICRLALLCAVSAPGAAQSITPLDINGKLRYHAVSVYGPSSLLGSAAYAGILHARGTPDEWGQGGGAYGKRVASAVGYSAVRATLAFGLDSTFHEDPRYFPSSGKGFWQRTGHALRGTVLTRTDSGRETPSIWRIGSAYGAAYLSNQWYPDRLNTVGRGARQGSLQLAFDFATNLGSEFWPDIKRKLKRRKP